MTGFGNSNDLTATTFAILGALDDSREIKHLDSSTIVLNLAWNRRQSGELVRSSYLILA